MISHHIIKINDEWRTAACTRLPTKILYQAQEIYQGLDSKIGGWRCIKSVSGNLDEVIDDKEALLLQLQSTLIAGLIVSTQGEVI